jgi:hypothetical protein
VQRIRDASGSRRVFDSDVATTPAGKSGMGKETMVTVGIFTPAHVLEEAIRRREVSTAEVVDAQLVQIARHNPDLNAIVTIDEDGARVQAHEVDAALGRGRYGALSTACRSPWRMLTPPWGCDLPGADCLGW